MVESSVRGRMVARFALAASLVIGVVTASGAAPASSQAVHGSHCQPPTGYSNVDIGSLGTGFTDAADVNNHGVVVGRSETPEGMHAFVWRRGRLTDITPSGGTDATVAGVNDRGQAAHSWYDPAVGSYRTAIWRNGRSTVIPGSDRAIDINERGEVLFSTAGLWRRGTFEPIQGDIEGTPIPQKLGDGSHVAGTVIPPPPPPGGGHPTPFMGFIWHEGVLTAAVPPPGMAFRSVVDVDRSGRVVFDAYGSSFALWHDGQTTDLGTLGGDSLGAADINEHGQIVGSSTTASGEGHAFLWENGTIADLHPVEGVDSWANKINERGEAAGAVSSDATVATVWTCGQVIPLDIAGAVVSIAVDINDRGQVLSIASTLQGDRVILSTPIRH